MFYYLFLFVSSDYCCLIYNRRKKMHKLKTFLVLILLVFVQVSCNTTEPPIVPPTDDTIANTILLTFEWKDLYRINLNWNKAKAETTKEQYTYILTQTDEQGTKTTKQF